MDALHAIETDDEVEVLMSSRLMCQQRIDAPSSVDPDIDTRRL